MAQLCVTSNYSVSKLIRFRGLMGPDPLKHSSKVLTYRSKFGYEGSIEMCNIYIKFLYMSLIGHWCMCTDGRFVAKLSTGIVKCKTIVHIFNSSSVHTYLPTNNGKFSVKFTRHA